MDLNSRREIPLNAVLFDKGIINLSTRLSSLRRSEQAECKMLLPNKFGKQAVLAGSNFHACDLY